jgi:GAF domain-containing protein/HAMP domain-containing protein
METKQPSSQPADNAPRRSARRRLFFGLRAKMMVAFILVALIPLGVMAFVGNRTLTVNLTHAANQTLKAAAAQTAANLDAYINSIKDTLNVEAELPVFRNYLNLTAEIRPNSPEEKEAFSILKELQGRNYILSYSLINSQGQVLLDTATSEPGQLPAYLGLDLADRQHLMLSFMTGLPYVSPVIFEQERGTPAIYYLAVIKDENQNAIGALISKYNASTLQPLVANSDGLAGERSFAVLLDENQLRLGQGANLQDLYKTVTPINPLKATSLQQIGRIPPGAVEKISTDFPSFSSGLSDSSNHPDFTALVSGAGTEMNLIGVARLKSQPWLVAFALPQSVFLAPVHQQTRELILLGLVIAGLSIMAALLVAHLLSTPILRLTLVAEAVTAGDLQAQADIRSADEIGSLALAFNTMTAQLRHTLEDLEQRVIDRTKALAMASEKSERRANQLQTLAEVADTITLMKDPELLLHDVTHLVSQQFGYDHVAIFLLDKSGEYAELRATNSEAGEKLLSQGYSVKVGQPGILTEAIISGAPRTYNGKTSETARSESNSLPFARSEAACPLMLSGKVIGILDVQSARSEAFYAEDVEVLKTLADQVAIAIENANLIRDTRNALAELQAMHRQYLRQEWDRVVASQKVHGFQIGRGVISPLPAAVYSEDEQEFVQGISTVLAGRSFPITVRGEVIGFINLEKTGPDNSWSPEDIGLAEGVVDQLGIALENARLLDEVMRRAARETQINLIATQVRSSVNTETILQNTVREVGKALRATRAYIQLTPEREPVPPETNEPVSS